MDHQDGDPGAPKLLADAMLGKLARWLRVAGYDTLYVQGEDAAIAHRARAEGRILLTRDRGLAKRRGLQTILVHEGTVEEQLAQVIDEVGEHPSEIKPRCMLCNEPLMSISPGEAMKRVPPYVAKTHDVFQACPACGRVYWKGTHWRSIAGRIGDRDGNPSDGRG
jgi:hypothetical protein